MEAIPNSDDPREAADLFLERVQAVLLEELDAHTLATVMDRVGAASTDFKQAVKNHSELYKYVHANRSNAISAGMQQAAARGVQLGRPGIGKKQTEQRETRDKAYVPIFQTIIAEGAKTDSETSRALNAAGIPSATSIDWAPSTVGRLRKRNNIEFL